MNEKLDKKEDMTKAGPPDVSDGSKENENLGVGGKNEPAKELKKDKKLIKLKRIIAVASAIIALAVLIWLGVWLWNGIKSNISTPDDFKAYLNSFGIGKYFVALGIQFLQVVIAFIPGELVEVGIGAAFGWFGGTLLCLSGVALASALIFLLTKTVGIRLVELFVDRSKIDQLKFLNSEKKLKRTVFILYFIPGTPKDIITYFIGLTRIKLHEFLIVSIIARIPSIVSSTIGGDYLMRKDYLTAIIIFAATAAVSLVGILLYNRILNIKRSRSATASEDAPSDGAEKDEGLTGAEFTAENASSLKGDKKSGSSQSEDT